MKVSSKIYVSYIIAIFFCITQKAEGQAISMSDSIEFTVEKEALNLVFQDLAEQTGMTFAYRNNLLEDKLARVFIHSGTFEELLHKILDQFALCFTQQNSQVIIHTACRPKYYIVSGYIVESSNQKAIPYVSVGLPNGSKGVIADHEGYFEINLDYSDRNDTLIFSCMGFQRDTLLVNYQKNENLFITLKERIYALPPATVRPRVFEFVKLGNRKDKPTGSLYLDTHGQQTALYIENADSKTGIIESVEYFLSKKGNVDAPFRVRIYTIDSAGLPDRDIVQDAIVVKPEVSKGWYKIDLSQEEIEFPKEGVFVAIEGVFPDDYDFYFGNAGFIDLKSKGKKQEKNNLLTYGQRLGYNRKCRKNTWHYSMSKVWFQIEKQAFGIMISATIKYEKNTDNYDQENK